MDTKEHPVLRPLHLSDHQWKNRLVVAPMSRVSATPEGNATSEMAAYYTAFARGGFSMIITEGNYTDIHASKSYPNQPGLISPAHIAAWRQVVEPVKACGTLIMAQLMHAGALSQFSSETIAPSAIQPSGVKLAQYGGSGTYPFPKVMSQQDIRLVKKGFADASIAAHQAGFDGVELHAANGYLLDQFLTPELNTRVDEYGGSTANRFRIIAEIIRGIRDAVPNNFLIGIRLSEGKVNDLIYRWKDGRAMATAILQEVKKADPDLIHIAVQSGEWERDSFYPDGSSYAALARKITGKPVIANGGMHNLENAGKAIEESHADLLSIGKAALADPAWPQHIRNGSPSRLFHPDMLWPEATIRHTNQIIMRTFFLLFVCLCAIPGFSQTANSDRDDANHSIHTIKTTKMKIAPIQINPDPYKPFRLAQGYRAGDFLFISGQTAIDEHGQLAGIGDFDKQADRAFENLEKVLKAGGSSFRNVIKVTILLKDMRNFNKIVALRGKYFKAPYPADTILEVSSLYSPDALIEIEAVAVADEAAQW